MLNITSKRVAVSLTMGLLSLGLVSPIRADKEKVGAVASDPGKVAEAVSAMQPAEIAYFAGETVAAVAQMPLSPGVRLRQMREVAASFLDAVPQPPSAKLVTELLVNVPIKMLPSWNRSFKPMLDQSVSGLDDAAIEALTIAVLADIAANDDLDSEAKSIYSTFALALLNRPVEEEQQAASLGRLVAGLPEAYRGNVADAAPAAIGGDYSLVLGPEEFRLVESHSKYGTRSILSAPEGTDKHVRDVNRPAPIVRRTPVDGEEPTPTTAAPSTSTSPVIPPPYAGQF